MRFDRKTCALAGALAALAIGGAYLAARPRGDRGAAIPLGASAPPVAPPAFTLADAPQDAAPAAGPGAPVGGADRTDVAGRRAAGEAPLAVQVRAASGEPVASALAVLFAGAELLDQGATDSDGRVELWRGARDTELLVAGDGFLPGRRSIVAGLGQTLIVLDPGARLEGRVAARDGRGCADLELSLASDVARTGLAGLPDAVVACLPGQSAALRSRTRSSADGAFAFGGLDASWRGEIRLPRSCLVRRTWPTGSVVDERSVRLDAPTTGLTIEIVELPMLTGRVVGSDGQPLAGHRIMVTVQLEGGAHSPSTGADPTDDAGRFFCAMLPSSGDQRRAWLDLERPPGIERANVYVHGNETWATRQVLRPRSEMAGPLDVGDIELVRLRWQSFEARDEAGRPLIGAVACAGDEPSRPTGADGRGTVGVNPAVKLLRVACLGHLPAKAEIPAESSEPILVSLSRAARLDVRVVGDQLSERGALFLRVAAPEPIFETSNDCVPDWLDLQAGASRISEASGAEGEGGYAVFALGKEGVAVLTGVRPRVPLAVSVQDTLEAVLQEAAPITLEPGEHRQAEIRLELGTVSVSGLVVDEGGTPLSGASVSLARSGRGARFATTVADGAFRFDALGSEPVDLAATKHGYAPDAKPGFVPTAGAEPLVFRLRRGRSVRVRAVDPQGEPVPASNAYWLEPALSSPRGSPLGDGTWELTDLPPDRVRVEVLVGGASYQADCDPLHTEIAVPVPAHGAASFRIALDPSKVERSNFALQLLRMEAPKVQWSHPFRPADIADAPFPVRPLLPGRWQAWIEREWIWREGEPVFFTVEAGRETAVELRR